MEFSGFWIWEESRGEAQYTNWAPGQPDDSLGENISEIRKYFKSQKIFHTILKVRKIVQGNGLLPWGIHSSFSGMISAVMEPFMLYVKHKNRERNERPFMI